MFFLSAYFFSKLLVVAGGLLLLSGFFFLQKKRAAKKMGHGRAEADAVVLSANKTEHYINNQILIKLQIQVQPEKGRNFVTEISETIPAADIHTVIAGTKLKVRYNPFNTNDLSLVKR